jgi:hypothetical protein
MPVRTIEEVLKASATVFHPVVPWQKADRLLLMDFTAANTELTDEILKKYTAVFGLCKQQAAPSRCPVWHRWLQRAPYGLQSQQRI